MKKKRTLIIAVAAVLLVGIFAAVLVINIIRESDKADDSDDWNVSDNNLAVFARLAYVDGKEYVGGMYDTDEISFSSGLPSEKLVKNNTGIFKKWRIEDYTSEKIAGAVFCATTFKNGKNIVVAFRGTDDTGEWAWNIAGLGLADYHVEEKRAIEYIENVVEKYPDSKIYITGHSLGGYLAQISAAYMIDKLKAEPEAVVYFNGIGLDYNQNAIDNKTWARDALTEYGKEHKLISYQVYGDIVSMIGNHSGEQISIEPDEQLLEKYGGKDDESDLKKNMGFFGTVIAGLALDKNVVSYYEKYNAKSIGDYFSITHSMDNFLRID